MSTLTSMMKLSLRAASSLRRTPGVVPALLALGAAAAVVAFKVKQAERRHPPAGGFLEVDGVRLHYVDRGLGRPVVFLHGLGSSLEDFRLSGVLERCSEKHRVIAFDRPGYGYSERPRRHVWTPMAQARLIHRALQRLGIQRPIVVGHSWGTLVAASMALQFPEDVASVVLASGLYFPSLRPDAPVLASAAIPGIGHLMRVTLSPLVGRLLWPFSRALLFRPGKVTESFRRYPAWLSLRPRALRAAAGEAALTAPATWAMSSHYAEIAVPTFLVAGDGDRYVHTDEQTGRLHRMLPGSTLRIAEGAGHVVHHMAPDLVLAAIQSANYAANEADGAANHAPTRASSPQAAPSAA